MIFHLIEVVRANVMDFEVIKTFNYLKSQYQVCILRHLLDHFLILKKMKENRFNTLLAVLWNKECRQLSRTHLFQAHFKNTFELIFVWKVFISSKFILKFLKLNNHIGVVNQRLELVLKPVLIMEVFSEIRFLNIR